ncbi:AraC family transcriptional regulator [Pedobacter sp. HMF7647]|uniref:AraC family transcriptional regulator n=1 Tax=Hufsiella arboris TaxID=2695275 RepID=A0A7K1YDB1_9SPHI|nr:AraC family transcriptional regulator [Hufsiella arboris]MXV52351.1 AraC family transcriptional regulator [Hufsiella arboris]
MNDSDITYKITAPERSLSDFVDSLWMLENHSDIAKDLVVVPDGRIDLFFSFSDTKPFHAMLMGLESEPTQTTLSPKTVIYAVSFKLPAIEYIFNISISDIVNGTQLLPGGFWGIEKSDLIKFEGFCQKVSDKIKENLHFTTDLRKQKLFQLIYSSKGALSVEELSEQVHWSSRQINRYFKSRFGMPLKTYCNILRFRASFHHIAEGKLFPEHNFADQAHFIKEIKRLSGVKPKDLYKNKNDRFLQLSALTKK